MFVHSSNHAGISLLIDFVACKYLLLLAVWYYTECSEFNSIISFVMSANMFFSPQEILHRHGRQLSVFKCDNNNFGIETMHRTDIEFEIRFYNVRHTISSPGYCSQPV